MRLDEQLLFCRTAALTVLQAKVACFSSAYTWKTVGGTSHLFWMPPWIITLGRRMYAAWARLAELNRLFCLR